MTFRTVITPLLAITTAFALAAPAAAHEYWLTPSTFRAAAGEVVRISAWNGEGFAGEPKLYAAGRTVSLNLHAARDLDLTRVARDGDATFARFATPDDSGAVVSFVSTFSSITLPADRFDAYLESDGLDAPRAARAQLGAAAGPGRERFMRCCKVWIAGTSARRALRELGLPMEITPLADPANGGTLRVRVTFEGRPLAGVLINAWTRPIADPVFSARTGPDGVIEIPISGKGEWLISGVHMVPSRTKDADWESTWSSLTFEKQ